MQSLFARLMPYTLCLTSLILPFAMTGCAATQPDPAEQAGAEAASATAYQPRTRHYYIAAEDVEWDYAPRGDQMGHGGASHLGSHHGLGEWGEQTIYEKTLYVEYTDETFTEQKPRPEHLGTVGPIIRGVVGDTILIHFKNNASRPYSIHPIGTHYDKDSEGASYGGMNAPGSAVQPGETYTYTLELRPETGPGPNDPSSILRLYRSHVQPVEDVLRGLAGPIIITRPEAANDDGTPRDVDREFVCMFLVFDENEGGAEEEGHLMHAINGFVFGNQPGLTMQQGEDVRWYLFGMGSEVDLHTPHWHGNGVTESGRRKETLMLLPSISVVADMQANNPGTWMFKCNVGDHVHAGMMSLYTIEAE
ncbi:MAG: multicopper oxidase domain-containing protein [Phycisphaeraceae bacterium]